MSTFLEKVGLIIIGLLIMVFIVIPIITTIIGAIIVFGIAAAIIGLLMWAQSDDDKPTIL